jgi:hypothetical protein
VKKYSRRPPIESLLGDWGLLFTTCRRSNTTAVIFQAAARVARAYQNAILWKFTGNTANGDTARNILNAWSSTLTTISGNAD